MSTGYKVRLSAWLGPLDGSGVDLGVSYPMDQEQSEKHEKQPRMCTSTQPTPVPCSLATQTTSATGRQPDPAYSPLATEEKFDRLLAKRTGIDTNGLSSHSGPHAPFVDTYVPGAEEEFILT